MRASNVIRPLANIRSQPCEKDAEGLHFADTLVLENKILAQVCASGLEEIQIYTMFRV